MPTISQKTMLPRAIQTKMDLRDARFRPLGDVNAAMRDLDMSAPEVDALLDIQLLLGFNIAVDPDGRRELRVLTRSIEHFRETFGSNRLQLKWSEIFKLILPHDKPVVTGLEIQRGLNCDRGHVENLCNAKLLKVITEAQPGPHGSPTITRASYEAFMKGRML